MGKTKVAAKLPRISRPAGLTRAEHPAEVPAPEHPHLPNWVRRIHMQASPIFGDLLAQLDNAHRDELREKINGAVGQISSGKFSQVWNYQTLIEQGYASWIKEREAKIDAERNRRRVDGLRKKLTMQIRDTQAGLSTETTAKLSRALNAAQDDDALLALEQEVKRAVDSAQSSASRRREREISRTRERISKASPRSNGNAPAADESWQDVLRRWQESGAAEG